MLKAFSLSLNYIEKWHQVRRREGNRVRKRMSCSFLREQITIKWIPLCIIKYARHKASPQKLNAEICDFVLDGIWKIFAFDPINEKIERPNWIIHLILDTTPEFRLKDAFHLLDAISSKTYNEYTWFLTPDACGYFCQQVIIAYFIFQLNH